MSNVSQQTTTSVSDSIANPNMPPTLTKLADVENSDRSEPITVVKPNSSKATTKPQSIVPKSFPVEDDDDDDDLAQQKILKHFNRY
jgi:hypothetical protein